MILVVTNRKLVKGDFPEQIKKLAEAGPEGIILREKDLSREEYKEVAEQCLKICRNNEVPLIVNSFYEAAEELGIQNMQLPYEIFMEREKQEEEQVGVSVHSREEAVSAEIKGADYLIAGHIYETNSKKNLAPRGLDFLKQVCSAVEIPVFAIGGIKTENAAEVIGAGASGICLMSDLMCAEAPEENIKKYRREIMKAVQS